MDYFLELYCSLPRAGPGDDGSTARAWEFMTGLPDSPRILDLGCGPGVQTLELLRRSGGTVVALDILPRMIERVRRGAEEAGLADRLETIQADMVEMPFEAKEFDVVWSEGALYFLGFENGLKRVKNLVRPGGYVGVSEAVWLKTEPPAELAEFWKQYPEIDTVPRKIEVITRLGYEPAGHFVLPPTSWTEPYYEPLRRRMAEVESDWKGIPEAEDVLEEARTEVSMFEKYPDWYGYAFFVMRRP